VSAVEDLTLGSTVNHMPWKIALEVEGRKHVPTWNHPSHASSFSSGMDLKVPPYGPVRL
jgi:hypothetical protein